MALCKKVGRPFLFPLFTVSTQRSFMICFFLFFFSSYFYHFHFETCAIHVIFVFINILINILILWCWLTVRNFAHCTRWWLLLSHNRHKHTDTQRHRGACGDQCDACGSQSDALIYTASADWNSWERNKCYHGIDRVQVLLCCCKLFVNFFCVCFFLIEIFSSFMCACAKKLMQIIEWNSVLIDLFRKFFVFTAKNVRIPMDLLYKCDENLKSYTKFFIQISRSISSINHMCIAFVPIYYQQEKKAFLASKKCNHSH